MTQNQAAEIESYKLSEIFSIVPEFEGDQIFLGTFLNACECAYNMSTASQRDLLVIHIKNKLRGRAAQLVSSRNPNSYIEIRQLLNLHFGDSRDLTSLIQDLQRLKQLQNESPLTFFNRLQVINAKMQACINKSNTLNASQKIAQSDLIDTMTLNTLLTGLDPRIGQIVRASNPRDLLEAHVRIRRELQLSYFETQQKFQKPIQIQTQKPVQFTRKPNPQFSPQRFSQSSPQHFSPRFNQNFNHQNSNNSPQHFSPRPNNNFSPQNSNNSPQRFVPKFNQSFNQSQSQNANRPTFVQNRFQTRPSVIQHNPNFNQQQRTLCLNSDNTEYDYSSYEDFQTYDSSNNDNCYYDQPCYSEYDTPVDFHNFSSNNPSSTSDFAPSQNYEDFLSLPVQNHPPINNQTPDPVSEIRSQIQTMNFQESTPPRANPAQKFI